MRSKKPVQRKLKGPTQVKSKAKARSLPAAPCSCAAAIYVSHLAVCPFCGRKSK